MLELIQAIPFSFGALFPVVNPIGSAVIFLTLVSGASTQAVKELSAKISIYATALLIVALFAGSAILRLFGITIPIVLIAGGMVLAYIGWELLNKPDTPVKNDASDVEKEANIETMAFYPLTMPVTAGPGCIAVAIAVGAHGLGANLEITMMKQLGNTIGICLVGMTIFLCYRYAYTITKRLGKSGMHVIMRLAAFINLCIGLELIWHGIKYLQT